VGVVERRNGLRTAGTGHNPCRCGVRSAHDGGVAWWCCLSLATPILCAFVCCDSAGGFWLAGRLERTVATQLASSACVAWTVVLYGGTVLENVVGLCIFVRLWRPCPRTARPAHASPSTLRRARARPSPRHARPKAQQHGLARPGYIYGVYTSQKPANARCRVVGAYMHVGCCSITRATTAVETKREM